MQDKDKNGQPQAAPGPDAARTGEKPLREQTGADLEKLRQDKRFVEFVNTTVISLPKDMQQPEEPAEEDEDEPRRGLGGWLKKLFRRDDDEEDDIEPGQADEDVLIPGRPLVEKVPETPENADETMAIDLSMQPDAPQAPQAQDATGEISLTPPAPGPAKKCAAALAAPAKTAAKAVRAAAEKAAGQPAAEKTVRTAPVTGTVSIDEILQQIDALGREPTGRIVFAGEEEAPAAPAAGEAAAAAVSEAAETAKKTAAAENTEKTEPAAETAEKAESAAEAAEIAAAAGQAAEKTETAAPAANAAPAGKAETAASAEAAAAIPQPAEKAPAEPILPTEPTGEISLAAPAANATPAEKAETAASAEAAAAIPQPAEKAPAAPILPSEPTGEIPLTAPAASAAPAENAETAASAEAAAAILQPAEKALAEPILPTEPTGEISLAAPAEAAAPAARESAAEAAAKIEAAVQSAEAAENAETAAPAGKMPAAEAETGEKPADAAGDDSVAPDGHKAWGRLLTLFRDAEEPDDALEESDETPAEAAGQEPEAEAEEPETAEQTLAGLRAEHAGLTLRASLTGILAGALLILGLMAQGILPSLPALDPTVAPAAWLGANLLLTAAAVGIAWPLMSAGLTGFAPFNEPSGDTLPAVSALAALLQLAVCLFRSSQFDPMHVTIYAPLAVLLLFSDLMGRRMRAGVVTENFALMSSGVSKAAAYRLRDRKLSELLCAGMDENAPQLLLNRPAAALQHFFAHSASPRRGEKTARRMAWFLLGAAALAFVITLLKKGGITGGVSAFAGVLALGAPLSATLIAAVPALLMQRSAARVGAVIPGWSSVRQLGEVDVIEVDAQELFPPMCAKLQGIKIFRQERIDLAILYAASVLIEGCNTLSGLFRSTIENRAELLYPVKDLEKLPGRGFIAWCDNCRVLLGTREMMTQEGIPLPALDYENRYSKDGTYQVMYLAVSGKLCAMFLLSYTGERSVAHALGVLRHENIRLLVTAEDPTLTAQRIEEAYRLRPGFVKVLNGEECRRMAPAVAYLPQTEGCMVHLGSFASFVGGLRAAAGADSAEHSASVLQLLSMMGAILLGVLLSFTGSAPALPLLGVLLYQVAWSALSVCFALTKRY